MKKVESKAHYVYGMEFKILANSHTSQFTSHAAARQNMSHIVSLYVLIHM